MPNNIEVLVVGAGPIAREYLKVLKALNVNSLVVGRGDENCNEVKANYPDIKTFAGGLSNWLIDNQPSNYAIVATPTEHLAQATVDLLNAGCKNILVEKPLTFQSKEAEELNALAEENSAAVYVAFNRRNYLSIIEAKKMINEDGGVSSFHFDFSEAIFTIDPKNYSELTTQKWGIANSSHVIDTAFFLGGTPKIMDCKQFGNDVPWHSSGSIFTGIGETKEGVPFTYHSNWGCPGRWSISIMTAKRKLLFSPMEKLHQQVAGGFAIELVELDYSNDLNYKPGFYGQVNCFLSQSKDRNLFKLSELEEELSVIEKIFSYRKV